MKLKIQRLWFNVIKLGQGTLQDPIYEIQFILSLTINPCRAITEENFKTLLYFYNSV